MSLVLHDEVCAAKSSFSSRTTRNPRPAASRAIPAPLMPPPTMARSNGGGAESVMRRGAGQAAFYRSALSADRSIALGIARFALPSAIAPTDKTSHEHLPRNHRTAARHEVLAPSFACAPRDRLRGDRDQRLRRRQA